MKTLVALVLLSVLPASAAFRTWTGGGGPFANWGNGANWQGGINPVSGDSVVILRNDSGPPNDFPDPVPNDIPSLSLAKGEAFTHTGTLTTETHGQISTGCAIKNAGTLGGAGTRIFDIDSRLNLNPLTLNGHGMNAFSLRLSVRFPFAWQTFFW